MPIVQTYNMYTLIPFVTVTDDALQVYEKVAVMNVHVVVDAMMMI